MKKWMISLLSVLAFALAFSGCGGSEGSSSVVGDNDTPIETPGTTPPADNGGNDARNDVVLTASKSSIEDVFGAVPANPGQTN